MHSDAAKADTLVLLIRHAESRPEKTTPEPDWPLSETGRRQARELITILAPQRIDSLYSSPFRRAVDTLRPFADAHSLSIEIEHDLRERRLVPGFREDIPDLIRQAWRDLSFALPDCESGLACRRRVRDCIDRLARENAGRTIAVASHGNAIGLYLSSLDPLFGYDDWANMRNPDVFRVRYAASRGPRWERS